MHKENTPLLETTRLVLRKFTDNDVEDMFLLYSDEEVNQFLPWFPFQSLADTRKYLHNKIFADYKKDIAYNYAVVLKSTGQVIGYLALCAIDYKSVHGDLGYALRKEFWNQGIITEAARAILARLKEDGFRFITATHDVNNPKSGKVMQKLGMSYQYSYEETWQPKKFTVTFNLYRIDF